MSTDTRRRLIVTKDDRLEVGPLSPCIPLHGLYLEPAG
jgi:hypothetical protein